MEAIILFRMGGATIYSSPLYIDPSHVSAVEAYERAGRPPATDRCTITMIGGKEHRVVGSAAVIRRLLGWTALPVSKAFEEFQVLIASFESCKSAPAVAPPTVSIPAKALPANKPDPAASTPPAASAPPAADSSATVGEL